MAVHGGSWRFMAVHGGAWRCMAVHVETCSSSTVHCLKENFLKHTKMQICETAETHQKMLSSEVLIFPRTIYFPSTIAQ